MFDHIVLWHHLFQHIVNLTVSFESMSRKCYFLFHNISTTVVLSPPPFKHFCVLYRILPADPQELELTPLSNYDCYKLRNQYQALSLIKSIHLPEVVYKSGSHQA